METIIIAFISLFGGLLGVVIGAFANRKTEKIKLHEINKLNAYKELIKLNKAIKRSSIILVENKKGQFEKAMKEYYENKVEINLPYYTKKIIEILEEYELNYDCIVIPDLYTEEDIRNETNKYIEKKLYSDSLIMDKEIKSVLKKNFNFMEFF